MADNYGVSFAPTQENSLQGPMNGQIDGLPAAIKILALRFPKFFGANAPAAPELLNAPGARGIDPIASAVLATMAAAAGRHQGGGGAPGGLPGGTAGPNLPGLPGGGPDYPPAGGPANRDPRIVFGPDDPPMRPRPDTRDPFGGMGGRRR
jgi:hypothetical protein